MPDDYDDEIDEAARERHEQAERQAKRDETLQWCKQRAERQQPPAVAKNHAERARDEAAATKYWRDYIRQQLDSRDTALIKAIAQAVVSEEKARQWGDDDLMTIIGDVRNRFDEMEARLNALEASKRNPAIRCDATPRQVDRGAFDGWRQ